MTDTAPDPSSTAAGRQAATADRPTEAAPAPIPTTLRGYITSLGPGIVVALAWVGTGDLIDNSVAGGNYGYALLWVLPLSLVFRFFFVNLLAKYPLYNVRRDASIVRGFHRTHPVFGWLFLIAFALYTHILLSFTLSGVGTALEGLFGGLPTFWWSVIGAASVLLVTFSGAYRLIERIFKFVLAAMVASFVLGIVLVGINWAEFVRGLAFQLPPSEGLFDSTLIASSLVLATLGSMTSLFYPQFLKEKGWTTPAHRKVQRYDLLFGVVVVFFLGVAIWAIGAEVLHGGRGAETAADIAGALGTAIGPIGPYIFYAGLLGAAWTTVAGSLFALSTMTVESAHAVRPKRAERYRERPNSDPIYKWMVAWGLLAVLWSLPNAPDFVVLVVVSHVLTSPFLLLILVGLCFMLNRRDIMGEHVNNRWENTGLAVLLVFVAVAAYQGIQQTVLMFV
ncbi:Nramp family divalent metal transporter [Allonocardiopsis opalescens]|uniref:Mn2+/Fe2+ NRAMP family transporter n=1 Tax=Allonocardiopsis opalescens TaxID=1144618 RepID=A0A2T0Q2L5_9ACTN|nr:Nramp family divalent metal transporter [Allonocardiopsis opalescens]PRX98034.1 Mn2+/Fe2+ NRAMP family transporter [Allonocardiopsis opalescens]